MDIFQLIGSLSFYILFCPCADIFQNGRLLLLGQRHRSLRQLRHTVIIGQHQQPLFLIPQVGDRHIAAVGGHVQLGQRQFLRRSPIQRETHHFPGACGIALQCIGFHSIVEDTVFPIQRQLRKGPGLHPGAQLGQIPTPKYIFIARVIDRSHVGGCHVGTIMVLHLPVAHENILLCGIDPEGII